MSIFSGKASHAVEKRVSFDSEDGLKRQGEVEAFARSNTMQSDLFVLDDLKLLMGKQEEWCVSIFMPTHRVTPRALENQIRFKNLVREAEEKLMEVGAADADRILEPARKLVEDKPFWHHQSDGLAFFLAKDINRSYRLPIAFDELVVVTDRFHTKPVLPLLTGDGRFYILALSQNEVRLFLCARFSVSEVGLKGVPPSLDEALKYDQPEKSLQFHAHSPAGSGQQGATFHGHGAGADDTKDRILRFCNEVDKGLESILPRERAPLIVAAVDYLVPIFRQASAYPRILEQAISGNPEGLSGEELHQKALEIVTPYFEQDLLDHEAMYGELSNRGKTASHVEEVVRAAYYGRVEVLFVPVGKYQWGEFDPSTDKVTLARQSEQGAGDLLDFAAAQTILNSGIVHAVNPGEMPDHADAAAILRY